VLSHLIDSSSAAYPVSGANLKKKFNIKSSKTDNGNVRAIIHELRKKNYPICANSKGYFYAETDIELSKFITKMNTRVDAMNEAIKGMTYAYHNIGKPDVRVEAVKPFVSRAVRGENNTVKIMKFELGPDGKAIIPAGTILV
jgi:hypothetical protein